MRKVVILHHKDKDSPLLVLILLKWALEDGPSKWRGGGSKAYQSNVAGGHRCSGISAACANKVCDKSMHNGHEGSAAGYNK